MKTFYSLVHFEALLTSVLSASDPWKAGLAKVSITPRQGLWMSGFAARTKPSEGVAQEIYAKALALEDPEQGAVPQGHASWNEERSGSDRRCHQGNSRAGGGTRPSTASRRRSSCLKRSFSSWLVRGERHNTRLQPACPTGSAFHGTAGHSPNRLVCFLFRINGEVPDRSAFNGAWIGSESKKGMGRDRYRL